MTSREKYYRRILEESRIRHKKVDSRTISTPVEKKVNWDKLSQHFKTTIYGKNMDGHLEKVGRKIH